MKWETIDGSNIFRNGILYSVERAKAPGGWLVKMTLIRKESTQSIPGVDHELAAGGGLTFVPDPSWSWDPHNP